MRVIVRADASPQIGGGHVMRCLTLADALADVGAQCIFACADLTPSLEERLLKSGHRLARFTSPLTGAGLAEAGPIAPQAQYKDAVACLSEAGPADWVVVDHYGLDAAWERSARASASRVLAIDDLANRPHDCDILLDQTFGRPVEDYTALVPPGCRILTGADFAPLRPEFNQLRDKALARRTATPAKRLLITLGSTDLHGITGRVLNEALASGVARNIDIVIGGGAPSLSACRATADFDPHIRLHIDSDAMAQLMVEADLAIGAAGATSWERCSLGLPSLVIVLTENQRLIGAQLALAGAHELVTPGRIASALTRLAGDGARLLDMSRRASQVTDGRGADRVRDAMLEVVE